MKVRLALILFAATLFWTCNHNPFRQGEILYQNFCASCHGENGEGFRDLYPPLQNSDYFFQNQLETACMVRNGMEQKITVNGKYYEQPMSAIPQLNAIEICNIINFLSHQWNPGMQTVTIDQVKEQLETCRDTTKRNNLPY